MEGTIIIAGENMEEIHQLRRCFEKQGQRSVRCKTVEGLIEELRVPLACNEQISFVIIDLKILKGASRDLINELLKYVHGIPFMLFKEARKLFLTKNQPPKSLYYFAVDDIEVVNIFSKINPPESLIS